MIRPTKRITNKWWRDGRDAIKYVKKIVKSIKFATASNGNISDRFVLPIGVAAEIDCDDKQTRFIESPIIWWLPERGSLLIFGHEKRVSRYLSGCGGINRGR